MKIMMISADFYKSRREFQITQAKRLGLDLTFVDAVSLYDLSDDELQTAANHWTRGIGRKDVACTLSHWKVWEQIAAQDKWVCVLEDDVLLSPDFARILATIEARNDPWTSLYDLEYAAAKHTVAKVPDWESSSPNIRAYRVYKNKRGAAAYVISPKAASRLRAEFTNYAMLESVLWTRPWTQVRQIEPCPAVQMDVLEAKLTTTPPPPPTQQQLEDASEWYDLFHNNSKLRAKLIRLKVSLAEVLPTLRGALNGERRPLIIHPDDFARNDR